MMKRIFITALALSLIGSSALAYIPSSRTIAGRVARNHGKGTYAVEQEVVFRTATEPVTLRERWIVSDGGTMRLSVSAPKSASEPYKFEAVYREGKRTAPDLQGSIKTSNMSQEFIEGFPHTRNGKGLLEAFVRARILPNSFLRERPRPTSIATIKHTPEALVRLGRSNGVVTWIFGEPTAADAKTAQPSVWIEQDAFDIRRLRFPSEAEVSADKQSLFAGTIKFPRERTVTWESNSVLIRVLSIKSLPEGAQTNNMLAPTTISAADAKAARLPDQAQVKEFYSRFR